MGFKVHVQPYLQHCAHSINAKESITPLHSALTPLAAATSVTWLSDLIRALESHQHHYEVNTQLRY